jgi:hypothetical protein
MSLEDARLANAPGEFGDPGTSNRSVASDCPAAKESKLRDAREEQIMSIAKEANRIARKQFRIDLIAINYRCYRHDYRYYRSKSRYQLFHFLGIEHFQKPLTIQSGGRAAARH